MAVIGREESEPHAARLAISLMSVLSMYSPNQLLLARFHENGSGSERDVESAGVVGQLLNLCYLETDTVEQELTRRCAACTLANLAACPEALKYFAFACKESSAMVQDSLFELLKNSDNDDDLVRYGCDAIANLTFSARQEATTNGCALVFSNDAQRDCLCEFLPISAEDIRPKAAGKDEPWDPEPDALGLPSHVVVAMAGLARHPQNQLALQEHATLIPRLAYFINARLDDVATVAADKLKQQQEQAHKHTDCYNQQSKTNT